MFSMILDIESSFKTFLSQVSSTLGFSGLLAVILAVEVFLVVLFVLRTLFSYELRLSRILRKLNLWLYDNKKINTTNIKEFNDIVKKGPKRLVYFWQQYILYREYDPSYYLSMENLIEKPLKTSSWENNIKNLYITTIVWSVVSLLFGIALEANSIGTTTFTALSVVIAFPAFVLIIGLFSGIFLKAHKITNLEDIYNSHHIFARFIDNACVDLPNFVDFDLLFSPKELEKASPQLREYYESRARKAKKEFDEAKKNDVEYVEYNFEKAGVDGSLVLERAMRETEAFINKKTSILAKIAQVETEKEALRRNYENVQKDLQRKLQACKENIQKFIEQQEATTNRMEVSILRNQQEQEIKKQESLQTEYDQEETRFANSSTMLDQEVVELRQKLEECKDAVEKAMVAEYQTFYEKVMKSAYSQAEKKVQGEKAELKKERDISEKELIIIQTQNKRLVDENDTLRARLGESYTEARSSVQTPEGHYDEQGNYIYLDGSYHDPDGNFHDTDGNVYDVNGNLIAQNVEEDDGTVDSEKAFGSFAQPEMEVEPEEQPEVQEEQQPLQFPPVVIETEEQQDIDEKKQRAKRGRPRKRVTAEPPKEPKKRGRPRKEVEEKPKKPVGRPKKVEEEKPTQKTKKEEVKKSETKKTVNKTSKKTTSKKPTTKKNEKPTTKKTEAKKAENKKAQTKKATKPATKKDSTTKKATTKKSPTTKAKPEAKKATKTKSQNKIASLERINELISQEETKLNKMKLLISSEINQAMKPSNTTINKERDKIMKEIEDLQSQAKKVGHDSATKELTAINERLETLIKEIAALNNK